MKKKIFLIISIILAVCIVCGAVYYFCVLHPKQQKQAELEQQIAEYYANKLDIYQAENETFADYEVDVAFLGDSLTDGYDLKTYYPQYKTSNRGIGGETTHGLLERMQVSVYDLKPKVAVMLIGGNNLDTMFEDYEELLKGLQNNLPETKVILVSLTSMGNDWAYKNHLAAYNNVKIRKLAEEYGYTFVDIFSLLLDNETNEIRKEYTTEGIHLTPAGYEVLTDAITPAIDKLMAEMKS